MAVGVPDFSATRTQQPLVLSSFGKADVYLARPRVNHCPSGKRAGHRRSVTPSGRINWGKPKDRRFSLVPLSAWWRRRESNPPPKAFDNDVYMHIRVVAGTRARRRPSLFRPRGASTRRIAL